MRNPQIFLKKIRLSAGAMFFYLLIPTAVFSQLNTPLDTLNDSSNRYLTGIASFYADKFEGRKTANGEIFKQSKLTCACNKVPLGTWLLVTNLSNNLSVRVRVNDRLHHKNKRLVDLTKTAAKKIRLITSGTARVRVLIEKPKNQSMQSSALPPSQD